MADMLWARSGSSAMNRASSLQSFKDYKQSESRNVTSSVDMGGNLLEYETLELRRVDLSSSPDFSPCASDLLWLQATPSQCSDR